MTSGSIRKRAKINQFERWWCDPARESRLTVVLSDGTGGRDVILDLVERADPSSVQVHDRATRLDQVTLGGRARG